MEIHGQYKSPYTFNACFYDRKIREFVLGQTPEEKEYTKEHNRVFEEILTPEQREILDADKWGHEDVPAHELTEGQRFEISRRCGSRPKSLGHIEAGEALTCLQEFDLKEEHIRPFDKAIAGYLAAQMAVRLYFARPVCLRNENDQDPAAPHGFTQVGNVSPIVEEFKETGKIPGYLFMTSESKVVWLSQYDIELLEEISP